MYAQCAYKTADLYAWGMLLVAKRFFQNFAEHWLGGTEKGGCFSKAIDDIVILSWLNDVLPSKQEAFLRDAGENNEPDHYSLFVLSQNLNAIPEGQRFFWQQSFPRICVMMGRLPACFRIGSKRWLVTRKMIRRYSIQDSMHGIV